MKKISIILTLLVSSFSFAQTVVKSFSAPTTSCGDIAWDGENLWVGGQNEKKIFKISPIDGHVIKTIPTTIASPYGLTFDGTYLWASDSDNGSIQKIDTLNGSVIATYPSFKTNPTRPLGLAWDGKNIWGNDFGVFGGDLDFYKNDSVFVWNPKGELVTAHKAKGSGPTGLGYGNGFLFSADTKTDQVFVINPSNYTVVDSFAVVGGTHPNGLAWDGNYLWLANNDDNKLHQLNINPLITSLKEEQEKSVELVVYPNPVENTLHIEASTFNILSIRLINHLGVEVFSKNEISRELILNVSDQESGIYFLIIKTENEVITQKIVKK